MRRCRPGVASGTATGDVPTFESAQARFALLPDRIGTQGQEGGDALPAGVGRMPHLLKTLTSLWSRSALLTTSSERPQPYAEAVRPSSLRDRPRARWLRRIRCRPVVPSRTPILHRSPTHPARERWSSDQPSPVAPSAWSGMLGRSSNHDGSVAEPARFPGGMYSAE